jgi:hypothetical protein
MKKLLFVGTVMVLSLSLTAASAAQITRTGADFSGSRGSCEFITEGTDLHVKCTRAVGAEGPAFVRYRFLSDVGGTREFADVSADITTWIGDDCFAEWMVKTPLSAARTLRITVPDGSYCHIHSVTWSQP